MVVCKFFLEGRCRFGDRCFNEHTIPRQLDHQRYESPSRDYQRYESPNRDYQRYESPNRDYQRYDSPNREYERYNSPQSQNRYRYESPSYQRNLLSREQRNNSDYGQKQNAAPESKPVYPSQKFQGDYSQNAPNPYQWRASNYQGPDRNQNARYDTPTATRNSFGVLGNLKEGGNSGGNFYNQSNRSRREQHQESSPVHKVVSHAESELLSNLDNDEMTSEGDLAIVKADVIASEMGGQWPFSCYSPGKNALLPGLEDLSPDEMRYQAYKAKEIGTFTSYVDFVSEASAKRNKINQTLKNPSPEIASMIKNVLSGKIQPQPQTQVTSKGFSFNSALRDNSGVSAAATTFFGTGTITSVQQPSEMETVVESHTLTVQKSSAFSFKLPEGHVPKAQSAKEELSIYTPYELLTKAEQEAFSSPTFILKKIPTRPPPKAMC